MNKLLMKAFRIMLVLLLGVIGMSVIEHQSLQAAWIILGLYIVGLVLFFLSRAAEGGLIKSEMLDSKFIAYGGVAIGFLTYLTIALALLGGSWLFLRLLIFSGTS
ncbi:MAG: hypothetical protein HY454_03400 [Parcubacteria group bacterium]|nr:hypothetical protein [Parcubacteria group bacterium]